MKNYLIFSFLFIVNQFVQGQPENKTFFGVSHKGTNWIAVGEEGTITGIDTSLGNTWFQSISFADDNNGIAAGWHGVIFRTTDGGNSWLEQKSETNHLLYDADYLDKNIATAVGTFGTIRHTTDGGKTWTGQSSATQNHVYGISIINNKNSVVVGSSGMIRRTTNGGVFWSSQFSGTSAWLYGVSFTDSSTGTAVGWNGTIIRTTNAGSFWFPQNSGTMQWLNDVHFVDSNIGTVVGCGGVILHTTNGGEDWIQKSSGTNSILFSVSFSDANNGVAVGESGTIVTTSNGGEDWILQSGSSQVQSHNFLHNGINRNYFIYLPQNYSRHISLPTIINLHGGNHYSLEYMYLTGMNHVADTSGFIAVYPNSVAGEWNDFSSLSPDIDFIEELIDTLSAKYNIDLERVYISGFSNGASMSHLLGCQLSNKIAAIAPVAGGFNINCNSSKNLPLVYQHGSQDFNVPYNQGQTALNFWIQNNNANSIIDTVELPDIDPNDGSTVTKIIYRRSSGEARVVFYKINNGGHQWSGSPLTIPNNSAKNMDINTSEEIWNFVKNFILEPTDINEEQIIVPVKFMLNQNYPNPFNPSTSIEYRVASSEYITLKVFDLLGREVAALVDEFKPAGNYEVEFDASNLSSGTYFYQLRAGEFAETKKLILLR